jgi:hypothetical protein
MKQKSKKIVNKSGRVPVHINAQYHALLKQKPSINIGGWVDEAIKDRMIKENIKVPE